MSDLDKEKFEDAIAEAQKIETKALEHTHYSGSLEIRRVIDFSPDKYVETNFEDLLNQYDRVEKVIKASKLYSAPEQITAQTKAKSSEIESKVKIIREESLHTVEEMSKEIEKQPEIKAPEEVKETLQFETHWETEEKGEEKTELFEKAPKKEGEDEFDKQLGFLGEAEKAEEEKEETEKFEIEKGTEAEEETPEHGEIKPITTEEREELEKQKEAEAARPQFSKLKEMARAEKPSEKVEKKELKPLERALARIRERKGIPAPPVEKKTAAEVIEKPSIPQVLRQEEPATAFEKIQRTFDSEWGEERDEATIKRKMLELTKELFRERTTSRREEIKQQIVVLKNMLAHPEKGEKPKKVKKEEFEYSSSLFSTLANTFNSEMSNGTNNIDSQADRDIAAAKISFQNSLLEIPEDDESSRKTAFDRFVFELTKISEDASVKADDLSAKMLEKHLTALDQFEKSLDPKDDVNRKNAEQKKKEIEESYQKTSAALKASIANKTSTLIEATSYGIITTTAEEEKTPPQTVKVQKKEVVVNVQDVIFEINSMDEGSLLYFLHSKEPETYKKFERGHLSRQETITAARRTIAKEKGLNDSTINKNWSNE